MKLYVTSDIHSYFEPFKEALDKSGFEKNNPEHLLITCGDCFDRGPDANKLLSFLSTTHNKVTVKGNHDTMLEELLSREYPYGYDKSNGTLSTVIQLGTVVKGEEFPQLCENAHTRLRTYFKELVPYYETENYVFVHGFIPREDDWRNGRWDIAEWENGMKLAYDGFNITGKTVVCGHWHCSYGWARDRLNGDTVSPIFDSYCFGKDAIWEPYQDFKNNLIAVDRCTNYTKQCNVLVIEDKLIK